MPKKTTRILHDIKPSEEGLHPLISKALKATTLEETEAATTAIISSDEDLSESYSFYHSHFPRYNVHSLNIGFGMIKGRAHKCTPKKMLDFIGRRRFDLHKESCDKPHISNGYEARLDGTSKIYNSLLVDSFALITFKNGPLPTPEPILEEKVHYLLIQKLCLNVPAPYLLLRDLHLEFFQREFTTVRICVEIMSQQTKLSRC